MADLDYDLAYKIFRPAKPLDILRLISNCSAIEHALVHRLGNNLNTYQKYILDVLEGCEMDCYPRYYHDSDLVLAPEIEITVENIIRLCFSCTDIGIVNYFTEDNIIVLLDLFKRRDRGMRSRKPIGTSLISNSARHLSREIVRGNIPDKSIDSYLYCDKIKDGMKENLGDYLITRS